MIAKVEDKAGFLNLSINWILKVEDGRGFFLFLEVEIVRIAFIHSSGDWILSSACFEYSQEHKMKGSF